MPKARKRYIIDRSLRVTTDLALIETEEIRPKALAALERSGFTTDQALEVHLTLALALSSYQNIVDYADQRPKEGEQRKELRVLIQRSERFNRAAGELSEALQALSMSSRTAMLYELNGSSPIVEGVVGNPRSLGVLTQIQEPLGDMIALAKRASAKMNSKGGRPKHDALRDLLLCIAVVWFLIERKERGVTVDDNEYSGPLLDFALEMLALEKLAERVKGRRKPLAKSPDKIGKYLHQLQDEAKNPKTFRERVAESLK